jgi:hypothetical protein
MPQQSEALVKERRKKPWLAGHASSSCRGSYCIRKETERDGEIKLIFMDVFSFFFFLCTTVGGLSYVIALVLQWRSGVCDIFSHLRPPILYAFYVERGLIWCICKP